MAHARIIRQNFYTHPLIAEKYDVGERYLLIGLACHADDFGRFWYNEASIRATVFPADSNINLDWLVQALRKFRDDFILCEYEVDGVLYAHFPYWFKKGWFLKQRLDHPREYTSPDCPLCETEKRKREISRTIKTNKNKHKQTEQIVTKEKIIELLTNPTFSVQMMDKYHSITKIEYRKLIDTYYDWVMTLENTNKDHRRVFEGKLMAEQELLIKKKDSDEKNKR